MCMSAIVGLGSAAIGAIGSRNAAKAQSGAAKAQLQLGREQLAASDKRYKQQRDLAQLVSQRQRGTADHTRDFQQRAVNNTFTRQQGIASQYQRGATNALNAFGDEAADIASAYQDSTAGAISDYGRNALAAATGTFNRSTGIANDMDRRSAAISGATRRDNLAAAGMGRDNVLRVAADTRDAQLADFQPYADSGRAANAAYAYELGIGERPSDYRGYEASPGYEFQRSEGLRAIDGSAAASGGLLSGRTLRDAMKYGTGLAQQDYGNHLARLSGQSAQGMNAAGAMANVRGAYGNTAAGAYDQYANRALGINSQYGAERLGSTANRAQLLNSAANVYGNTQQSIYGNTADMTMGAAGNVANMNNAANTAMNAGQQSIYGNVANMNATATAQRGSDLYNAYGQWGANRANAWGTYGSLGQGAAAQAANSSANAYNFMGNALANYGDARASGAVGMTNALTGGIQNGLGYWQMNQMLQSPIWQGQAG